MKWINAGDIKNWATSNQRHCQQTLPELVRRLILATAGDSVEEIDFPSGDSIATGGWDGRLRTSAGSPFFPSNVSGWEIGTDKSAATKAEADYAKRTAEPLGMKPSETTFVFITPRAWPKHEKWQNDKRASGVWKDVRVINADGLEQWLDSAPAVAIWLARQIDKVSGSIRDLETDWEEWSVGTNPTMSPILVISGRTRDAEAIQKWIAEEQKILEVQGDHPDEAFAFLYASIATLPEAEKAKALARCVVIENIDELRQLTQAFQNYPLIIAAPGECIDAAHAAIAEGHHVFISMDAAVIAFRDVFRLARPNRGVVEKILHEGGLSEAEAQRMARDSGRSIPVLRRHLFQSNAVSAPGWANAKAARMLIPVLFANAWDEQKDGDRQVLETLSGMSHDAFARELMPFLSIDDSPIRKVGSIWMIKSPLDSWFLLASYLTQDYLKLFEQSLLGVLTKADPKYELEAEKRWAAAIYGKSNPYSGWLRTGLVESLVLLAVYGNRSPRIASTQAFAEHVVRGIFATADKWEAWASIKEATPLLSEAAPDTFMEAVEQGIGKNPAVFQELMKDDPGVFGECRHSGLLWALEGIAWSSEYFARSVNILVNLSNIDSGGRWCNRAINSLGEIFLPGFPQTHAKPKERLQVLEKLIAKNPQLVWKFTHSYFGDGHVSESNRFRWRDTGGDRRGLEQETNEEYREYITGLLTMLRDLACLRENLVASIDEFIRLPEETREKLLTTIVATDPAIFPKEERDQLLEKTRGKLNWINSYGEENHRAHVPALNRILEVFAPTDVLERVGWLLSNPWPRLPQGESKNHDPRDIEVRKAQREAAREVLDNTSLERILEFAGTIPYQDVLGHSIAMAVHDEGEDNTILDAILTRVTDMPVLVGGYAVARVEVVGPSWIDQQIERIKSQGNYNAEACASLYSALPEGSVTWSAVCAHGKDVETAYWKRASGHSRADKNEDAPIAVEKLLDAGRPGAALQVAGNQKLSLPSVLLQRLIRELLEIDPKDKQFAVDATMYDYYIGHVFNQIYERNELSIEEIAALEWPFAELFKELKRYTSSPMALHRALQNDPQFFAQLITVIYKRDDHAPDPSRGDIAKEMVARRAQIANQVLDSWYLMPGVKTDGTLDEKELSDWVEAARKQCTETKHVFGCDVQIGFMLAHAPADPDGAWPHVAVRNLIESLNNGTIERYIQNEIYNSRGVVSRGLNDGGAQERGLAEKYKKMSDATKSKWPRTSAMLRSIAGSYENDAKRVDIDTDLHDLRWD